MASDVEALICSSRARDILDWLSSLDPKQRRRYAGTAIALFRQWQQTRFRRSPDATSLAVHDEDALKVAVLGTATSSELRPVRFALLTHSIPLVDVMRAFTPDWLDGWVEDFVEAHPALTCHLAPLWRSGLCRRPGGDARILGYYDHWNGLKLADEPGFVEEDVWRFFEVEGGGDLSLACHDKYRSRETWSGRLLALADRGALDRQRLLDASLDALERDFGQFRASWYSRFHEALRPSPDERSKRRERYLHLLSSSVPPTVAFALKSLRRIDAAGGLRAEDMLNSIEPALLARQKSAATDALHLLAAAAKREPKHAHEIALAALTALVSDCADVQAKVLDLVSRLGEAGAPDVQALLAEHKDLVAPSVRERIATLLPQGLETASKSPNSRAVPVGPTIPPFAQLTPCESLSDTLIAYLAVLENARDPLAVERAVDGVARHGAAARPGSVGLSPVAKRCRQILEKGTSDHIRLALAALGSAWCGEGLPSEILTTHGTSGQSKVPEQSLAGTFLKRCDEVIASLRSGYGLPLLSLPSDSSGEVEPHELIARTAEYRSAGIAPGTVDLALALTRLGTEKRDCARNLLEPRDEIAEAVAFALGDDDVVMRDGPIWAAAWLARRTHRQRLGGGSPWPNAEPDAGVEAQYRLNVRRNGEPPFEWCHPFVTVTPPLKRPDALFPASLLHRRPAATWSAASACGYVPSEIAWAALVRPGDPEAFFANGIGALDPSQKLADHPCIAYLDAFDRLKREPGAMGYALLAYYPVSTDKSVTAQTVDKLSRLIERDLLSPAPLADALLPLLLVGTFPAMRWTRSFAALVQAGSTQEQFVRELLTSLMRFHAESAPDDIGGMVELLYELQLGCGRPLADPAAAACLTSLSAKGGKAGRFAGKLLTLSAG